MRFVLSTTVILWAEKPFAKLSRAEKDWTVYLHTALQYLLEERATNTSLRARLGLKDSQTALGSKLFKQAIESGLIRVGDEKASNKNKYYVPYWVTPVEKNAEG